MKTTMNVVQETESGLEDPIRERRHIHPNLQPRHTGSSAFASTTQRGEYSIIDAPPPGAYNVVDNKIHDNWHHGTGNGLLGSGATRFKDGKQKLIDTPGPGQYSQASSWKNNNLNRKKVGFVSTQRRFGNGDEETNTYETPGPGSYNVDPLYGNFNRKTFNMSIAEQEMY